MHRVLKSSKAGRAGSPVNYGLNDRALPLPPAHVQAIREHVDLESTADLLGKRPAKWNISTLADAFPKFSRQNSHLLLNNICTVEDVFNDPDTKGLQCWYFPRPPKKAKNPATPSNIFKAGRLSQVLKRPDVWGAWNISTELQTPRTRRRSLKRSNVEAQMNSIHYFETHIDSLTALRENHKRGKCKAAQSSKRMHPVSRRKGDIEAVLNLT